MAHVKGKTSTADTNPLGHLIHSWLLLKKESCSDLKYTVWNLKNCGVNSSVYLFPQALYFSKGNIPFSVVEQGSKTAFFTFADLI